MRYIALILAFLCAPVFGQFTDKEIRIQQWDAGVSSFFSRIVYPPAGSANGILFFNATSGRPEYATVGSGLSLSGGILSGSGGSVACASVTDATATGCAVLTASNASSARSAIGAGTSNFDGAYGSLTGAPVIPTNTNQLTNGAGFITGISSGDVTAALGFTPYSSTNPSGYRTQAQVRTDVSLTTTGSGAATYNSSTGVLNIPPPAAASFNFGYPSSRTVAVNTSYQATDPSKAAIITPSYACQNATQVLASSACTLQVRMGSSALTCSTGTVVYTQSLTVNLGVLLTQNSTNPVQINLPIGGYFIICPSAGTFTVTTVEQTAG